jgi:FSR family fosmidomycin resistance protein-like MFS transporter
VHGYAGSRSGQLDYSHNLETVSDSAATLRRRLATFHWMHLFVLSSVHFFIDMFPSMLPAILPAILNEFSLSLSKGGLVMAVMYLTCNGVQPLTGHLRADKRKPLFLYLGLALGTVICLLDVLPREGGAFGGMVVLAVVSGFGIAIVHPEGLRGVHRLRSIKPAVSTAVFMAGGFLGYASGGAISAFLVSRFGLQGLYPIMLCPVVGIVLVLLLRVRLAVERTTYVKDAAQRAAPSGVLRKESLGLRRAVREPPLLRFWSIFFMAMPAAVSTTIIASLLPTALNELGFDLTFGGLSATTFGLGGAIGSFVWAHIAHRKGELECSIAALLLAIPFVVSYLVFINSRMAIWILFGAGFCAISAYILMITLSRNAAGLTLGQRMGFMVGGTWGLAYVVFMALLPAAEHFGSDIVLKFSPVGYLLSGILGLRIMLKVRRLAPAKLAA